MTPRFLRSCLVSLVPLAAATADLAAQDERDALVRHDKVELIPSLEADGDSFEVRFENGKTETVRLYGADCPEILLENEINAERLRHQRLYFGLADIEAMRRIGLEARSATFQLLERPFTVYASRPLDKGARIKRAYAFVRTADGVDLAEELVRRGLARAYGVNHRTPEGGSAADQETALQILEEEALHAQRGAWARSDPGLRATERERQRKAKAEIDRVRLHFPFPRINPNTASRLELITVPGIGPETAEAILQARKAAPFTRLDDLRIRIRGIGPKTLEGMVNYLEFGP